MMVISSFALADLLGAGVLLLPWFNTAGLSPVDALFTSTSAVCVTGLTVVNTATAFTVPGKIVILALIQIGGLGVMTFSVLFTLGLKGHVSLSSQKVIQESFLHLRHAGIKGLISTILVFTLVVEGAMAAVMTLAFMPYCHSLSEALFQGLFHSVSAFCNAGFSTFQDGLESFRASFPVSLSVMAAVFLGSTGFAIIYELWERLWGRQEEKRGLSLHFKVTMLAHLVLLAVGTMGFMMLEADNMLTGMDSGERVLVAAFHSVSARTAGFNTVSIQGLTENSLYLLILLMFIGACPSSTGGGIKTTTAAVLFAMAVSRLRGFSQTVIFRRTIPEDQTDRAVTLFILAVVTVLGAHMLLMFAGTSVPFEHAHGEFLAYLFEAVSGLGTVGLSVGITPKLGLAGKLVMIVIMFVGRVGLLSILSVLSMTGRRDYHYSPERVMIG